MAQKSNTSLVKKNEKNETIFPASDLSQPNRHIWIVTSASLPWMTGTAVNPLLRALYCSRIFKHSKVTLVLPWLTRRSDREKLFGSKEEQKGDKCPFDDAKDGGQEQQRAWIRHFAQERCDFEKEEAERLEILFYHSVYFEAMGSIFPTQDICSHLVPDDKNIADFCILEEPEHLNWIPPSNDKEDGAPYKRGLFKDKFNYVVGIIHTNYPSYAATDTPGGPVASFFARPSLAVYCGLLVRAHCHRVIRLSGVIPDYAQGRDVTENVHGVRAEFIKIDSEQTIKEAGGQAPEAHKKEGQDDKYSDVYYIGKLLWAKGFKFMIKIEEEYFRKHGHFFKLDVYGGGPDDNEIKNAFWGKKEDLTNMKEASEKEAIEKDRKERLKKEREAFLQELEQVFRSPDSLREWIKKGGDKKESKDRAVDSCSDVEGPFSILCSAAESTVDTGIKTTKAVVALGEKAATKMYNAALGKPKTITKTAAYKLPTRESVPIPATFLGVKNHVLVKDLPHKVFLNPSESEVLCTTSAEALAMGKFVILPKHPSNEFFYNFPNCLPYETIEECVKHIEWALAHEPHPMTKEVAHTFTWEAATERLVEASKMSLEDANQNFGETRKLSTDDSITRLLLQSKQKAHDMRRMLKL